MNSITGISAGVCSKQAANTIWVNNYLLPAIDHAYGSVEEGNHISIVG